MLTADLVKARRYQGELRLPKLIKTKADAAFLDETAAALLEAARGVVGEPRAEVEDALALDVPSKSQHIARGLKKLVLDRCTFEEPAGTSPAELRQALFLAASKAWREAEAQPERDVVLAAVAERFELDAPTLDEQIFADLRAAQRLTAVEPCTPRALLDDYELGRAQAVLLKARELRAEISCADAATLRAVFRALRFHGLLFRAEPTTDGARLTLDGPFSLFKQSTRYGLRLAIALKILAACERCTVEADVVWGKQRTETLFRWDAAELTTRPPLPPASTRDEVETCLTALRAAKSCYEVEEAGVILDAGGQDVCIPDVALTHRETGERVYLEVLGFWSRDAVWRRVELVEKGAIREKVIFAYSSRLRVSEAALDEDQPSCLLSFKGALRARAVIEVADRLTAPSVDVGG